MQKRVYLHTIGCQMNVYDSDQIVKGLRSLGYRTVSSLDRADLIILNTCAIREKAQQKAYSYLGRLAKRKRKNPDLIIGVGGCVAQQEGKKMLTRMPHLDFVFGTRAIGRLPGIIRRVAARRFPIVDIEMSADLDTCESRPGSMATGKPTRFVTIMRGCDNYCAYCVVPYVRGHEVSRNPEKIIQEIQALAAAGVREVTLLGQNVNSYGSKEGLYSFVDLLKKINDIRDIQRIRFTTSHPKDLSVDLMRAFAELEKLCNHIHLPVQSGSDRILKRMNRGYTREGYLEKVALLRHHRPDIAVTSDFIVGFPGETKEDFKKTLDMIHRVQYDGLFAFKYSDRPSAPAVHMSDKVPEREKQNRLQELLSIQDRIAIQKNQALVHTTQTILVDGLSRNRREINMSSGLEQAQWTGRTTTNKIVNFSREKDGNDDYTGRMVPIKIERAFPHSLWGRPVGLEPEALDLKGESYAA